ncbi:MAG: helix-turn-helix domain-containing protein [Ileibacterium sp.]|nr:helix-turn-helix domain-containing protein [Ileibacterium sp.]
MLKESIKYETNEEKLRILTKNWGENESFYRELYYKKQESEQAYEAFLSQYRLEDLLMTGITIPDKMKIGPVNIPESNYVFNIDTDIAVWCHSRYTPPWMHGHTYYEIMVLVQGEISHTVSGHEPFIMQPGDVCFIPDGVHHEIESYDDDVILINIMVKSSVFKYAFFDILSDDNILAEFFSNIIQGKEQGHEFLLFQTGNDQGIVQVAMDMFFEYYFAQKHYSKVLIHMLHHFFALILRHHADYYIPSEIKKKVEILNYIKTNYATVTLKSASQYFHYNEAYFSRLIKEYTGSTFVELVKSYKMESASQLLRETNFNISQISRMVGYNTIEHFNRSFKDYYEMTPTRYRAASYRFPDS